MKRSMYDLCREIGRWGISTFPTATRASIIDHLRDEVVELEAEIKGVGNGELGIEAADCFLLLTHLAERNRIPMASIVGSVLDLIGSGGPGSMAVVPETGDIHVGNGSYGMDSGDFVEHFKSTVNDLWLRGRDCDVRCLAVLIRDCFLALERLTRCLGVDLFEFAEIKFGINKERRWGQPDGRGVVRHLA